MNKVNIFILLLTCTCRQVADTEVDYVAVSDSLVFDEGVTSQSFTLSILQDTTPEIDEYIFIVITNVQLNESSVEVVDTGALPSVAPGNDSVALVVISENDNARGVVELSGNRVETPEPSQEFISVNRQAGAFGEVSTLRRRLLPRKHNNHNIIMYCFTQHLFCCGKTEVPFFTIISESLIILWLLLHQH